MRPLDIVNLRPQLDAGHVLQSDHGAVGIRPKHDRAEFLRGNKAALGADRVGEFLARGHGLRAYLAGRINRILLLKGVDDVGDGEAELTHGIGVYPYPYGILAGAKNVHLGYAGRPEELVDEIDIRVVCDKSGIVCLFR